MVVSVYHRHVRITSIRGLNGGECIPPTCKNYFNKRS